MYRFILSSLLVCLLLAAHASAQTQSAPLRAPSVPLVVHDPYFSIWSPADKLTDAETVHWTGKKHPLHALIRIDGKPYRLMGAEPKDVPALEQIGKPIITATQTRYRFLIGTDGLVFVTFTTPLLPNDLDLFSRPATYITFRVATQTPHKVELYFDAGGEIAVNTPEQSVKPGPNINTEPERPASIPNFNAKDTSVRSTTTLQLGSVDQEVLGKRGDDVRIDWGHLILSTTAPKTEENTAGTTHTYAVAAGNGEKHRSQFAQNEKFERVKSDLPAPAKDTAIVSCSSISTPVKNCAFSLLLAYDDEYSIRYFEEDLRPWWKRNGKTTEQMITEAWNAIQDNTATNIRRRCVEFDKQMKDDLTAVGGEDYAALCALAYRQSMGAQKLVADKNGMPLMFSKENFSNGSIGTVDIMYPTGPLLLYYSPALTKATLQPILDYGASKRWKFPFAPHDIGTYPHATGQTYGGGETSEKNQMPVEESANVILLAAALLYVTDDTAYIKQHWGILTKWADYLLDKGYDPENQLCTDDFAGHLAHNVNLSAKAIVGLGAFAQMAEKLGEKSVAEKYRKSAEAFAAKWIKDAAEGDHTRLAFDKPNTWSMKYNLMWDEILDLKLFPRDVFDKEIAFYKTKINTYGLPLDNRSKYTKNDWILWTAAMTANREDFDALVKPVIGFVNSTENRVPLSDWYWTDSAKQRGFQARSVVGGFWAPMLKQKERWKQQTKSGADTSGTWAPLAMSEIAAVLVPTAEQEKVTWRYTTQRPAENWFAEDFDVSNWKEGKAGFGTEETPGAVIGTVWNTSNIWISRTFDVKEIPADGDIRLMLHHDEDAEVYLNGKLILQRSGYTSNYSLVKTALIKENLRIGRNTLAIHCKQTQGGQYIDAGFVVVKPVK